LSSNYHRSPLFAKYQRRHFRERMQTNFPKAELQFDIELQHRRLLRHCLSKGTTIIFYRNGHYMVVPKEEVTRTMLRECEGFTVPDRIINGIPVYLDGEPHLKRGVKNRDDRIDKLLESCGLMAHRFPYRGRLSKHRLMEICNQIERRLDI